MHAGNRAIDAATLGEIAGITEVSGAARTSVEAMVDFVTSLLPSATNPEVRRTVKKIREQGFENMGTVKATLSAESIVRTAAGIGETLMKHAVRVGAPRYPAVAQRRAQNGAGQVAYGCTR